MQVDALRRVLIVSPHADDEVLGCGGLLARLSGTGCEAHVMYMAVDGSRHYGLQEKTTFEQRVEEIEAASAYLGFTYEIVYGDLDLLERLDTLPKRELVDCFEQAFDRVKPELLLLPYGVDYDQDHVAVFETAFAAARPIGPAFGKWLPPNVLTYEMTKLGWSQEPLPRPVAYLDISEHLEMKLQSIRLYESQRRLSPHIRSEDAVRALASLRGKEIGAEYGEAFAVLRTIIG